MAISFEIPEKLQQTLQMTEAVAKGIMRGEARRLDENEHERPTTFISMMWPVLREQQRRQLDRASQGERKREGPGMLNVSMVLTFEMLSRATSARCCACRPRCWRRGDRGGGHARAEGTLPAPVCRRRRAGVGCDGDDRAGRRIGHVRHSDAATLDPETNEWVLNGERSSAPTASSRLRSRTGSSSCGRRSIARRACGDETVCRGSGTPGVTVEKVGSSTASRQRHGEHCLPGRASVR